MRNNLLLTMLLFCSFFSNAQTYSLTVNGGYGSGTYKAGDTVHIWCRAIEANEVFNQWTGDVTSAEFADEWHTTLVMPNRSIAVTANFIILQPYDIVYEKMMGRDTLKNVYYYFPNNIKGVIYLLHGTSGTAGGWITNVENRQFVNDAIANEFGVIITEAEEITKRTDTDANDKLRWATNPVDTVNNVDYVNIKIITETLLGRGLFPRSTPRFSVGMSNGGSFSVSLATIYRFKAGVSYCAQGNGPIFGVTTTPIQFCMAKYDKNDQVGASGNAQALTNSNVLNNRNICSKYFSHDRSPVYPERFLRRSDITTAQSTAIFNQLKSNGVLDSKNYLLLSSDSLVTRIMANPAAWSAVVSLTGAQQNFVKDQIDAMYAEHKFYSDYNKRTLQFLKSQCNSTTTATEEAFEPNPTLLLYPNPTSDQVFYQSSEDITELIISDLNGKIQKNKRVFERNGMLELSNLPAGIYLVQVRFANGNIGYQKLVKQ